MTHLLEFAQANGNPVIEGTRATLVWKGKSAPLVVDDLHGWEESPQKMRRDSSAKDLWTYSLDLDPAAYFEYALLDPRTKSRVKDPLNPNSVYNGLGSDNHFFYMPGASPTPLVEVRKGVPRGRVTHHFVETGLLQDDGTRELALYRPPVKTPVPLLLVYDGMEYLQRAKLNLMVDNLIHEKRIQPIAMAFLYNGDDHRPLEYACSDGTLMTLDEIVLPFARKKLNLLDVKTHHGAFGVLGASFGGLMSMYTGLRMPDVFGAVISQSAVFEWEGRDFAAVDLIRAGQARELRIHMSIGHYDELLEENRRAQSLLIGNGYNVRYSEFVGGHNFTSWQNQVPAALEALFPA